jgi:DNA-directed RNA polymerase subunit RPC12/RpoP
LKAGGERMDKDQAKMEKFQCEYCLRILLLSKKSRVKYADGTITCSDCEKEIDEEQQKYRAKMKG